MSDNKTKNKSIQDNIENKKNRIVSNGNKSKNNNNKTKNTGTPKKSSNNTTNVKKKTKKKSNTKKSTPSNNKKEVVQKQNIIVSSNSIQTNSVNLEEKKFPNYEIEDFVESVFKEIEVSETNYLFYDNNLKNDTVDNNDELIEDELIDVNIYEDDSITKVSVGGIDYQVSYKKVKVMKLKKVNLILLLILLSFIIIFTISFIKIFDWGIDNKKIYTQIEHINNITEIVEVVDEGEQLIIDSDVDSSNPYWDYIKMNLIDVDINGLKELNSDTKGWIQVNGTNINYPFVQTADNDFYLTHSFDKTYNDAGWVFLDYRNDLTKEEKNTIIYAHSRIDKSMFGSLKNILTSDWLNNPDNYIIKLSTEYENTLWQIFSVYHIPTTVDYLKTKFISDEKFLDFSNMLLERSQFNFNTNILSTDRILTLSTCYNNTEKVVLHAKLIKRNLK